MTRVQDFNSLPFEQRDMIRYYQIQARILGMKQFLEINKDDISPRLRKATNKKISDLEKFLKDNYVEEKEL